LIQREQEKAVALLETSPLLSYLFLSYVIPAKAAPDSSASDHNEELSALKLRSERLESELAVAQVALTEAHSMVASLREEVQQLRSDLVENRSRDATVLEENERERERLRKEAQTYKVRTYRGVCLGVGELILIRQSKDDTSQKTIANQRLEITRINQQSITDKAALQTRINELQVGQS